MLLGITAINQLKVTEDCVSHLIESVEDPDSLRVVIIDNESDFNYDMEWTMITPFSLDFIRNDINQGYYMAAAQLAAAYDDDIICIMHNDLFIYEYGWDGRIKDEFNKRLDLGLIGFVGSWEIDPQGGRGSGTCCNFKGVKGAGHWNTGHRVEGMVPSVILDSVFMGFKREALYDANITPQTTAPCHFYDKIIPLRLIRNGWRVGTLGIECDHASGTTEVGEPKYNDMADRWCQENGIPFEPGTGNLAMFLETQRRMFEECGDMIPLKVNMRDWTYPWNH